MKTQRGVALLAILVVVSLVTVLVVDLAHSSLVRLSALERRQEAAQAWQIWRAGLEWGRDILAEDARRTQTDHLDEYWARGIRDYPAEGGLLTGRLEDQQALFNLNNLVRNGVASEVNLAVFRRLLAKLNLDPGLAAALADWLDSDRQALPGGAEEAEYADTQPSYRPANRPMPHLAELYRVRGFDPDKVERLQPYVTTLPEPTPINVNTAPLEVLSALLPGLDTGALNALLTARATRPFTDLASFQSALRATGATNIPVEASLIQFRSQFFLLRQSVSLGRVKAEGEALLDRAAGLPTVVWQARGLRNGLRVDNPLGAEDFGKAEMGKPEMGNIENGTFSQLSRAAANGRGWHSMDGRSMSSERA